MRNFIIGILAAVTILWIWAILAEPKAIPPIQDPEIQTSFGDAYMEGCIDEDGTYEFCNCTYTYMLKKLGVNKFYDAAIDYVKTGVAPKEMYDAVKYCQ